jgi:periplasmic protein TonB
MSESSVQPPLGGASALGAGVGGYQLSDDLARLCLPQEFKDSYRRLAWANSICFLFLLVGLVGLRPPQVVKKPLSEVVDVVPAVYTPPEQENQPPPEEKPPDEELPPETPTEALAVPTVVAASDASVVSFPVQVPGPVRIAASGGGGVTPPPPISRPPAPSGPSMFNRGVSDGGTYPPPVYPPIGLRNRYQGTVTIDFKVDEGGAISEAKIEKTSGFAALDEAALDVVKKRWRFPPGTARWFQWPCVFKMN